MKVHTLNIDSSERDTSIYTYANNYVVNLDNPIYDISNIKLVSARIPTPQLMTSATNKTFSVDGVNITLNETNYSNGYVLAEDLDIELAPSNSHIDSVIFDKETDSLVFSNTQASDDFTIEFYDGTNGYLSNTSSLTTPHQIMGFSSKNFTSTNNTLRSGAINLNGPNSLVLKLTTGSDEFTQTVYTSTPFYTGHILLDGYDFRNQDHILKFEITGSTEKLENLPKVPIEEPKKVEKEEPIISIPEVVKNSYIWRKEYLYIALIVIVGLLLIFFMKGKPISGSPRRRAARA